MQTAPFKSDFLLLDVKKGRHRLADRIKRGEKVAVWIKATIEGAGGVGGDDGVSIEFTGTVHGVKVSNGGAA